MHTLRLGSPASDSMASMRTVEFGELKTSVLGFGCGSVMGRVGRGRSLRAMHAAWEAGVTLFDTARSYGYGEAEALLGEFLVGKRSAATVVTKFGILPPSSSPWKRVAKPVVRGLLSILPQARQMVGRRLAGESSAGHFDATTLRASLDESLRHLHTDYVDVLLAHEAPASVMAQDDLIAELERITSAGKARRVGLSCSSAISANELEAAPRPWSAVQFPVNVFQPEVASSVDRGRFFRMANHPFGGTAGVHLAAARLQTLATNAALTAELREKLQHGGAGLYAEIALNTALAAAEVVVPSMLQLPHLHTNIAALKRCRFSAAELAQISAALRV